MNTALQRFIAWMLLASLPLAVTACGGGGDGGSENVPMITISVATKGVIQGASVTVYKLLPDGRTGDLLGSGTEGAPGIYSVNIPASQSGGPLLVSVTGKTGATRSVSGSAPVAFTAAESFHAIINDVSPGQTITVSPLTEAAYKKLQQILTVNPALATAARIAGAVNAANSRIATLFGVINILADPANDTAYQAALLIIDQMIVDLGPAANSITVMNLINSALSNVASPAYQAYLQALDTAANKAALANPALATAIRQIVTLATTPSAEPDWTDITPPTAPSNLRLASTTNLTPTTSSVTLSWTPATDAKGVTGYSVYRDGVEIATVAATSYTDQPLANNATYTYYVIAFDGAGNRSVASNQLAVPVNVPTVDVTPPSAPTRLSASTFALSPTTSSVVLMWSQSFDNKAVTGYEIYRDGNLIATVATPGYTDPLVSIATTYSYYVVALDAAGNRSAASSPLTVTPNLPSLNVTVNGQLSPGIIGLPGADIIPPSAPSALTAATFAQTATTSSVVLSWNPSTDNIAVTGYEIYRNGVRISTVTTTGYTDPAVTSGSTYNYFIMAFDAAGNRSIASNQLSVTPNVPSLGVTVNGQLSPDIIGLPIQDIIAPTAPTNLTATTSALTATTSSVTLSWNPSTDNTAVTGYEIYRGGVKIATVATPGYTDPSVASTLQHTYYIIAFDAAGNRSSTSNQLLVTPNQASLGVTVSGQLSPDIIGLPSQDIIAPTAPTNLTATTSALNATTSSAALAWNLSTDNKAVTGYEIFRDGVKIATVATPGYTDSSLSPSVLYTYYVIAVDAAGNRSNASNQLLVTPSQASLGVTVNGQLSPGIIGLPIQDVIAPTAPASLTASTSALTATTSSVTLLWNLSTDNTAVTGYEIYRNGVKIATVSIPGYTDPSVASGSAYTYYVMAIDAAGNRSSASNQQLVTPTAAALGVTFSGQLSSSILGF